MITLFTDFGWTGPYVGQMHAVLQHKAPDIAVVDLMHDAPFFNPRASAWLLAALAAYLPPGTVSVCVVDPGVGGSRRALALEADARRFVGPDNGLMAIAARRAAKAVWHEIIWRPEHMSASFHGRDLFAPVAARWASGQHISCTPIPSSSVVGADWPDDLFEVIYADRFGNTVTGIRAKRLSGEYELEVSGRRLAYAQTFSAVGTGEAFWYANSIGLVEIAVNQGNAAEMLGLDVGCRVDIHGA